MIEAHGFEVYSSRQGRMEISDSAASALTLG